MCAARSQLSLPHNHRLQPASAFRRRFKPRPPANDNRSRRAATWRAAGAILGAALAGCTALAVALVSR